MKKKPKIHMDLWNVRCTEEFITDNRVLIWQKDYFQFPKTIQMLVSAGRPFELNNHNLKYDFTPPDNTKLELNKDFSPYIDAMVFVRTPLSYSDRKVVLKAVYHKMGDKSQRAFFDPKYVDALAEVAGVIEVSNNNMMRVSTTDGKKIALLMGFQPDIRIPFLDV